MEWLLEIALVGLLVATLLHAIRLQRALAVLRQDRAALGEAVAGFDSSTRQAEAGLGRLQSLASEAGQQVARQAAQAASLRDDLVLLSDRGEQLANRLEALIRAARGVDASSAVPAASPAARPAPARPAPAEPPPKVRSQAERDLLLALRGVS